MTEVDVRPQRARRRLGGARVLARKLRVEPCPTFRRRAPRHGCQPCLRGSRLSSRVPWALSLSVVPPWRHTLSTRTVLPTGTCRAPATVAAGCLRVRSDDGTTTALHHRPGKEGPSRVPRGTGGLPPLPRPEQLRVEGSPLSREGSATIAPHQRPEAPSVQMVAPPRSASPAASPRRRLAPPSAAPRRRPMIINTSRQHFV